MTSSPLPKRFKKTRGKVIESLTDKDLAALAMIKEKLMAPPNVTLPKKDEQYNFDTNTCYRQVGFVLHQEKPDGELVPIGYWS